MRNELEYHLNTLFLSMADLDWPVGVTPDIKALKARISQRRQQQLSRDTIIATQPLKNKLMLDTFWLDVGHNSESQLTLQHTPITMCAV